MKPESNLFFKRKLALSGAVLLFYFFAFAQVASAEKLCEKSKEAPAPDSMHMEDGNWLLEKFGGTAVSYSNGEKPLYIKFDARNKKVSGFAGCNTFFAGYKLNGFSLTIGPLGSTRKACPEPHSGLEAAFFKLLGAANEWKIEGDILFLLVDGNVLASFTAERKEKGLPDLNSMTFLSTFFPSGKVTLVNGEYREPGAPGSASETVVKLTQKQVYGKLDGKQIGVAVLVTETGGSGVFYNLALLSKEKDGWVNSDILFLGDRIRIDSVEMTGDTISLAMKIHKVGDPMCCPTNDVVIRFIVKDGGIRPLSDEVKVQDSPQMVGPVWQWVRTLYNNDTKTAPPEPKNYTVQFLSNGGVNVKADCNMKGGTYSLKDGKLNIRILNSTMAMCEKGSLEDQFVKDLTAAASVFLNMENLYIGLKYDTGTMGFEAVKEE